MIINFHLRIFITQFTGTGCPHCPTMLSMLRNFAQNEAYKDLYVLAAVHSYNSDDPMYIRDLANLLITLGGNGFTSVCFDMNT